MRAGVKVFAWQLAILAVCLGAWEMAVTLGYLNPFWASSPVRIGAALAEIIREPLFPRHVATTLIELVAGFGVSGGSVAQDVAVAEAAVRAYEASAEG